MPLKLKVCDLMCEDKLDGIEAYNGNCNWVQEPEKVKEILERHPEYIQISASDFINRTFGAWWNSIRQKSENISGIGGCCGGRDKNCVFQGEIKRIVRFKKRNVRKC